MPQKAAPQKSPEDMSLEELEAQVIARAQEVSDLAEQRYGVGFGAASPEEAAAEEPAPMEEEALMEEPILVDEGEASPESVMSATAVLTEAGLLASPSESLTPEVLSAISQIAEQFAPGLYDMANPAHVTEILDGIINGTIPITASAPEPGPEPAGEPEPGLGSEPLGERPSGLPYGGVY